VEGNRVGPNGHGVWEQPPAKCSDFETADLGDLKATPLELTILNLCRYAGDLLPQLPQLAETFEILRTSPFVVIRMFASQLDVQIAMSAGNMAKIAKLATHQARELAHTADHRSAANVVELQAPTPKSQVVPESLVDPCIKTPILSCLLIQLDQTRSVAAPSDWLIGVESIGLPPELHHWLQLVCAMDAMPLSERWAAFTHAQEAQQLSKSILYAIGLADESAIHARQILRAHIALFQGLQMGALDKAATDNASQIIERQWMGIAAQTFRLRNPRLTVPMLEEALTSGERGLGKIARILRAGLFALGVSTPTWLDSKLKEAMSTD
jgi:hypothetical protein